MKKLYDRARLRASQFSTDEWIISLTLMGIMLPDIFTAVIVMAVSMFVLIHPARRRRIAAQPSFYIILMLLPIVMISAILAGNTTGIVYGLAIWFMLIFMLYVSSAATLWFTSNIMDILLILSVVSAVVGLIQIPMDVRFLGRILSIYENPNYYGYAIEIFVLAAIYQYMHKNNSFYLVLAAGNIACNLMCGCRTAWAAILVSVTLFVFLKMRKGWLLGIMLAAAVVFFGAVQFFPELAPRLSIDALMRSLANRTRYWGNAAEWFLQRPIIGYGAGGYGMLSELHGERVLVHAHSLVLNLLLDFGIIGAAVFTVMLLRTVWSVFKHQKDEELANTAFLVISVIAATLVHGITDVPIFGISSALMFVTVMGVSGSLRTESSHVCRKLSQTVLSNDMQEARELTSSAKR